MTRFRVKRTGAPVGARFSGDNGATFHITTDEALRLFDLDENEIITSDNTWEGTAKELQDMLATGIIASQEEMARRFNLSDFKRQSLANR